MDKWIPCSGLEMVDGMVWVKRMAQKARRAQRSRASQTDCMNGYLYGESDFLDGRVLRFLGTSDTAFVADVCSEADDEAGVRRALARSGRTASERREFSAKMEKELKAFPIIDADEGRLPPGFRTNVLKFFYNSMMMPIVYIVFRRAEQRRRRRG